VVVARCGRAGGESSSGFGVCLLVERKKEVEEATASSAPRLSLSSLPLPLSSLSPSLSLLSLFRTSDASSPLFVVVSLVSLSLCEN
jgi:hypothetical protein